MLSDVHKGLMTGQESTLLSDFVVLAVLKPRGRADGRPG